MVSTTEYIYYYSILGTEYTITKIKLTDNTDLLNHTLSS